jgi:hypothetical protein
MVAEIDLASKTEKAFAAEDSRIEGDSLAGVEVRYLTAYGFDHAGRLVSHHNRRQPSSRAAVVAVYIAAADAASLNPYQEFFFAGLGFRHVYNIEFLVLRENERFHRNPPHSNVCLADLVSLSDVS